MLVIKKRSNNTIEDNADTRRENHAYNIVLYILKNFSDLSGDDQFIIYNKMLFNTSKRSEFNRLKAAVLVDYNQIINHESVTMTDLKAGYHLSNGMLESHFDSIEQINDQLMFYEQEFIKEKNKLYPDIDKIAKISLVMERLINRRSILNVGTPVILFFRYQLQKQKLEMQRVKEEYQQKSLNKITIPNQENPKHIQESKTINLDSNNIDELERRAKLKDPRIIASRGNTHKQDNNATDSEPRVQPVTDVSNSSGTGGQDTGTEDPRSGDERRTKEAKF